MLCGSEMLGAAILLCCCMRFAMDFSGMLLDLSSQEHGLESTELRADGNPLQHQLSHGEGAGKAWLWEAQTWK